MRALIQNYEIEKKEIHLEACRPMHLFFTSLTIEISRAELDKYEHYYTKAFIFLGET